MLVFTLHVPALLQHCARVQQVPGCTVCFPATSNFYIVMSQDVVTVAIVLEMHACVGRDQHFMLLAILTKSSAHNNVL